MNPYSKKFLGVTFLEQAILSLAAFAISIGSSRWLTGDQLTSFYLGWSWMWGFVAAVSEGILTPTRLHDARNTPVDNNDFPKSTAQPKKELEDIGGIFFLVSIGFILVHFVSQGINQNIVFLIIAGVFAFQSFQCLRFSDIDSGRTMRSFRRSFTLCFLQLAHIAFFPSAFTNLVQNFLLFYIISLLLLSLPRRLTLTTLSASEVLLIIHRGKYFAMGTLVRAILFSSILISVLGFILGGTAVNRFGVVQSMAAPALFITAALCTGLIPSLRQMIDSDLQFREITFRLMSLFVLVGGLLAFTTFVLTERFSHLLFGEGRLNILGVETQNLKLAAPFFIFVVTLASSIALIFQLFQMGKAHLILQISSGLLAIPSVFFVSDYWIVSIPYLLVVFIFPIFIWNRVR